MKKANEMFKGEYIIFSILLISAGIGLFIGWKTFWFLTDDAYIAFRYVSNSILGHGYVWNAPPFLPVEGYSSFLWVAILDIIWKVTGLTPPEISNLISYMFSYFTLVISSVMIMKIPLNKVIKKRRIILVFLLLVFLLSNRTFLTWSSSGLETALFNFLIITWVYIMLFAANLKYRIGLGSLFSALITLTRPDGLLFCIAMLFIILIEVLRQTDKNKVVEVLVYGTLPLSIVLVHESWRLSFYGEWLPNTYYAKVVSAWPESGILYVLSFVLEYSIWFVLYFISRALISFVFKRRSRISGLLKNGRFISFLKENLILHGIKFMVITTLLAHLSYYTFIVGGDHFEYRVYSYTIPIIFMVLVWSLNLLKNNPGVFIGLISGFILLSMPVQWTHWALTKDLNTRDETYIMQVPISKVWPAPFKFYAELFDKTQSWLISHFVCMRHQEHKVFWKTQINAYPSRENGNKISSEGFPVHVSNVVGVPSWVLPNVNIIDIYGLNDFTIARTPVDKTKLRRMAHSRHAPKGYIQSYFPNIIMKNREIYIWDRKPPLTEKKIQYTEYFWRKKIYEKKIQE